MNLATLNINDGWPIQSQFYFNSKLSTTNYNLFANDGLTREDHFDVGNSVNMMNSASSKEVIPEAFYSENYQIVDEDSDDYNIFNRNRLYYASDRCQKESNFCAVDTSNSNCPLGSRNSFVSNYNHVPLSNQSKYSRNSNHNDIVGEKKYISELHINIKDPNMDDMEARQVISNSSGFQDEFNTYSKLLDNNNHQSSYHLSNLEAFIASHHNDLEFKTKNSVILSDIGSSSSESPNRKRECHHSEKFIYLGCDSQTTPQMSDYNNDINSFQSPTVYEKGIQMPFILRSRDSDNNEDPKSFSSKSVQTSKKIDCIFKTTCDRSMVTDILDEDNIKTREEKSRATSKINGNLKNRSSSSESKSDKESSFSENYSEDRMQKGPTKNIIISHTKKSIQHEKMMRKQTSKVVSKKRCENVDDTNQDTYAGSYTESFSESNPLLEIPVKVKSVPTEKHEEPPIKQSTSKIESKKLASTKNNMSNIENKLILRNKPKKGFSEKKETVKLSDQSNCACEFRTNYTPKDDNNRHSPEIQCLLDNLNTHLQNTVNCHGRPTKMSTSKGSSNQFNNIGSFWDNPLNPETTRSLFMGRQMTPKHSEPSRQKSINPEIQAIFETLEKSHNYDKIENSRINQKQSPSNDLNSRNQKMFNLGMGDNHSVKMCGDAMGSVDNLHDVRFPPNLRYQKSFDLSPYDELVKSHLNSSDRRIKSVAAKNGCRIVIDGPISLVDPTTTCQAIRNKIAYRCVVAGPSKDRLDKCLNYLKETFPNTCLRLHSRNSMGVKS